MDASSSPRTASTWQVHIDRSMWIGGVRGLMLQALHPIAMRGVWQNSNFQEDPFGRLQPHRRLRGRRDLGQPGGGRPRSAAGSAASTRHCASTTPTPDGPTASTTRNCCCGCTAPRSPPTSRSPAGPACGSPTARPTATWPSSAAAPRTSGCTRRTCPARGGDGRPTSPRYGPRLKVTPEAPRRCGSCSGRSCRTRCAPSRPGKPAYFPFGALCYYSLPAWARRMYGILPEVPGPVVTAALRSFRLTMNSLPEALHDRSFHAVDQRHARGRPAAAGAARLRPEQGPVAACATPAAGRRRREATGDRSSPDLVGQGRPGVAASGRPARPDGQCRRKSHQEHIEPGAAGKTASIASIASASPSALPRAHRLAYHSSAADASSAISSARRRCRASDSSVCSQAATVPVGRWCSSTRRDGRRNVRGQRRRRRRGRATRARRRRSS